MLKAAKKVFGANKAIEAIFDEERGEVTLAHVIRIISDDDDDIEELEQESMRRTNMMLVTLRLRG